MAAVPASASPQQVAAEEQRLRKVQMMERATLQARHSQQLARLAQQEGLPAAAAAGQSPEKSLMAEIKGKMEADRVKRLKAIQVGSGSSRSSSGGGGGGGGGNCSSSRSSSACLDRLRRSRVCKLVKFNT